LARFRQITGDYVVDEAAQRLSKTYFPVMRPSFFQTNTFPVLWKSSFLCILIALDCAANRHVAMKSCSVANCIFLAPSESCSVANCIFSQTTTSCQSATRNSPAKLIAAFQDTRGGSARSPTFGRSCSTEK